MSVSPPPTRRAGRVLGEFTLGEKIGEGGFGEVYRATQHALERDAVVKILHARHGASDVAVKRFLREGKLACAIDHPYAAHIYACGAEPDGVLWIAMEYVRGTPLATLIKLEGAIPLERCIGLLDRLCEVVGSAHERGIIHRDIKPANVMVLSRAGRLLPKLLDLGIAVRLDDLPETSDAIVGSPLYMAPERWEGGEIHQSSDIYALGVLAFECLTGRPPFHAPGIPLLACKHADEPVPPLGHDLPARLDAVIAKALAKRPDDRFATALELGAALREATKVAGTRSLPVLPTHVETAVTTMPRPISAALAGIQHARTEQQLRLAIARTVRSIVRYAGAIALAARARFDAAAVPIDEAKDLLLDLRRQRLDDRDWIDLASCLCAGFGGMRDAFPVPELVDFALGIRPGRDALRTLVRTIAEPPGADDDAEGRLLGAALVDLATVLEALDFLATYQLVVGAAGGAERWMGHDRVPVTEVAKPPAVGAALLVDVEGHPVLDLGPLVKVAEPVPGVADDVFVFDGKSSRGATLSSATGFQLVDDAIWDWLGTYVLARAEASDLASASIEASPYRGLATFGSENASMFFGRERELTAFRNRLRVQPLLAVVGASGAGKSSFVHAGVLPDLDREWHAIVMRPGHAPLAALAAAIAGPDRSPDFEALLTRDPAMAGRMLRDAAGDGRGRILVIDQLEEIFTMCHDAAMRDAFAAALADAARTQEDPVRVIVTLRDDFLVRTQELAKLREQIAGGLFLLATPSDRDLLRIVTEPCRRAGYEFDDRELPARMVADVAGRPAALALLSFAAEQLWELRDRHFRRLSEAAYRSTGGVAGALARHADGVIGGLRSTEREAARTILLRLVSPERTRLKLDAASLSGVDRPVLDALVRGRLVVADGTTYELAHEVLIVGWPTLARWLSENLQIVQARGRLAAAVTEWLRLDRASAELWREPHLAELRALAAESLTADERAFVKASSRAVKRRRFRRRAIMVAIPAAIAVFYGGVRLLAQRDLDDRINTGVVEADSHLRIAQRAELESAGLRRDAFARFDANELDRGEELWKPATERADQARSAYAQAARALEAAFLLDTSRDDVRDRLSQVTFERLQLAIRDHRDAERADFESRLSLYDSANKLTARLSAPATLDVRVEPATVLTIDGARFQPTVTPGVHLLVARAPGRAEVRMPLLVKPAEHRRIDLALPLATSIPDGFVFVPAGNFLYGSRDDDYLRRFFITAPLHELRTNAYLIAKTEVTYAQWIAFLDDIPSDARARRVPHLETSQAVHTPGALELLGTLGAWELRFNPSSIEYTAKLGAPIEYRDRPTRQRQDWLQFPVSGISPEDAEAFTAWLDKTGKVPRARLCDEREWERAARGADARPFPQGDKLAGDDANIDETYGRRDGGFGPDVVGSHPVSISPFGLFDTSGNVWEITRLVTSGGFVMRGGGFYTDSMTAHLANRQEIPPTFRHLHTGVRVCADPP